MIDDLVGFFIDPVIDSISRPFLKAKLINQIKIEDKHKCDFCSQERDLRLGSGLLCGYHYYKFFPSELKNQNDNKRLHK